MTTVFLLPGPTSRPAPMAPGVSMSPTWMQMAIWTLSQLPSMTTPLPGTKTMVRPIPAGPQPISRRVPTTRKMSMSPTWTATAIWILSPPRERTTPLPGTKVTVQPIPAGPQPISRRVLMVLTMSTSPTWMATEISILSPLRKMTTPLPGMKTMVLRTRAGVPPTSPRMPTLPWLYRSPTWTAMAIWISSQPLKAMTPLPGMKMMVLPIPPGLQPILQRVLMVLLMSMSATWMVTVI